LFFPGVDSGLFTEKDSMYSILCRLLTGQDGGKSKDVCALMAFIAASCGQRILPFLVGSKPSPKINALPFSKTQASG
jgi:hypothetical protein